MPSELEQQLTDLKLGNHICPIFESAAEQISVAVTFIKEGLARGERCLYVADDLVAERFVTALAAAGVDVAHQCARGTLRFLTKRDSYLKSDEFDPQAMISFLSQAEAEALAEGFSGLRVVGEMTWALGPEVGCDRLIEYEALLNDHIADSRSVVICQYDRARFAPALILDVLRCHPVAIVGNEVCPNPFYEPPRMILGTVPASERVDWKITQLKRARATEQITHERHALLHAVVEGANDAIFVKDRQGRYLMINSAGARFLGKSVEKVLGKHDTELFASETARQIVEDDRRIIASGATDTFEQVATAAGITRTYLTAKGPYRDKQGNVAGIVGIARDITERKRAEAESRESADRLQALSRRVVEVQEEERRHLARELHDEIGQVLSAIIVNLQAAMGVCDAAARTRLEESIQLVDQTIHQVRNLSLDLRPSMLDDLGLVPTLRWYADRQAQRAGFALHFEAESSGAALPHELATCCYRVVQEALTNVVRHAQARNVWLEIRIDVADVSLVVRDDGVGFDPAAVHKREAPWATFGVMAMQERVQLLGGEIEINPKPAEGTTIRVKMPIGSTDVGAREGGRK